MTYCKTPIDLGLYRSSREWLNNKTVVFQPREPLPCSAIKNTQAQVFGGKYNDGKILLSSSLSSHHCLNHSNVRNIQLVHIYIIGLLLFY